MKKILLQCQGIIYYYMGLSAIYTKYPKHNVEIDVLFSSAKASLDYTRFIETIKSSIYINNVYPIHFKKPKMYAKIISKDKSIKNLIQYNFKYKKQLIAEIKDNINDQDICNKNYSEIYFSHEQANLLITSLKFIHPKAKFMIYGDGPGQLFEQNSNVINKDKEIVNYKFFKEIRPNRISALLPYKIDNSMKTDNLPISVTDKKILIDIIQNDYNIQKSIIDFTNEFNSQYKNREKNIILLSCFNENLITVPNQVELYLEIINKYCSENSVCILKNHPSQNKEIIQNIKSQSKRNIIFIELPEEMSKYPIEIFYNLIKDFDNIITFVSSSIITLKYLYNIDSIMALDIIEKYFKDSDKIRRLKCYNTIVHNLSSWDKKSLIYSENMMPLLTNSYKNVQKIK